MKTPITDRITGMADLVTRRLDRLSDIVPEPKPPRSQVPFDQYLAQANAMATRDPEFKARLDQAMQQYQRLAEEVKNATQGRS